MLILAPSTSFCALSGRSLMGGNSLDLTLSTYGAVAAFDLRKCSMKREDALLDKPLLTAQHSTAPRRTVQQCTASETQTFCIAVDRLAFGECVVVEWSYHLRRVYREPCIPFAWLLLYRSASPSLTLPRLSRRYVLELCGGCAISPVLSTPIGRTSPY